jgi:hypothetical protein
MYWYVWPEPVLKVLKRLEVDDGCLIGLVGVQGVGKSSALYALYYTLDKKENQEYRVAYETAKRNGAPLPERSDGVIHFKWRREAELYPSLLDGRHECHREYYQEYMTNLIEELKRRGLIHSSPYGALQRDEAEQQLRKDDLNELRRTSWHSLLRKKRTILIDTPDYARSDRRVMTKDLGEIYTLWDFLSRFESKPNMVIAIQKEMFHGHFFFDKMERVEVTPLKPGQLLESYQKRFRTSRPFTKEALLTLARMSRGVYRRYLRYITLTLDRWEQDPAHEIFIDAETVN